jgi:hypothetical protein
VESPEIDVVEYLRAWALERRRMQNEPDRPHRPSAD